MARLTNVMLGNIRPGPKRREIADGGQPGLYLIVNPTGAMSWAYRYRHRGKPAKLTLGSVDRIAGSAPRPEPAIGGHLSIAEARKLAADARHALASGDDPAAERMLERQERRRRAAVDFPSVTARFVAEYAKPRNRTWRETERQLGIAVDKWRHLEVQDVTKGDVRHLMEAMKRAGKSTSANRLFAAVRKLFRWCIEQDLIETSPCTGLTLPSKENSRDRVLSDADLATIWKAAEQVGYPYGTLAQLLMLTAARRGEVAGMRWSEIKVDTWIIPPDRFKTDLYHHVPLTAPALAILARIPRTSDFVLTTTGAVPISSYDQAKRSIDTIAKVDGWQFHDLRRTAASGMAAAGIPVHVIEAVLGHRSGKISGIARVYNRYDFAAEKRSALETWAGHVMACVRTHTAHGG